MAEATPQPEQARHTPGPWRWHIGHYGVDLRTPDRGQLLICDAGTVGRFRFAVRTTSDRGGLMHEAGNLIDGDRPLKVGFVDINNPDARLIAAAPDLLAACKKIRRSDFPESERPLWDEIQAAIAKAGGVA